MVGRIRCSRFFWSKVNFLRTSYPQNKYKDKLNPNNPTHYAFQARPDKDNGYLSLDLCNTWTKSRNLRKKYKGEQNYLVAIINTKQLYIDSDLKLLLSIFIYWEPVIFPKLNENLNVYHFTIKVDEDNYIIPQLLAKYSKYL